MTPLEKMRESSEPHRQVIGWTSIIFGVTLFGTLGFIASTVDRNRGAIESSLVIAQESKSIVEKAMGEIAAGKDLPILIHVYDTGSDTSGILLNWPKSAERLLGWTRDDIHLRGLSIMMPERYKKMHDAAMKHALADQTQEHIEPKVRNTFGLHKDGSEVPIAITVWVSRVHGSITANAIIRARVPEGERG